MFGGRLGGKLLATAGKAVPTKKLKKDFDSRRNYDKVVANLT